MPARVRVRAALFATARGLALALVLLLCVAAVTVWAKAVPYGSNHRDTAPAVSQAKSRAALEAEDQRKFAELKAWTVANGGWVSHKLGVQTLPEYGGHGLVARQEMAKDESYVCVPYRVALSQSTLNISGLCEPCFRLVKSMRKLWHISDKNVGARVNDVDSSSIILGLFMALQRFHLDAFWPKGGAYDKPQPMVPASDTLPYHRTYWQPQIQMLPDVCANGASLGLYPELVDLMDGSPTAAYLEEIRDVIVDAWARVCKLKLRVPLTFEQFVWGVCQYRSHYEFVEDTYESAMVPIDDMTNFDSTSWDAPNHDFIDGGFEFARLRDDPPDDDDDDDDDDDESEHPQTKCWADDYDPFARSDVTFGQCRWRETPKAVAQRMKHFNEGMGNDENRNALLVYPPELKRGQRAPTSFYGAHARFAPQGADLRYAIEQLHKHDKAEDDADDDDDDEDDDDDDDDDDDEDERDGSKLVSGGASGAAPYGHRDAEDLHPQSARAQRRAEVQSGDKPKAEAGGKEKGKERDEADEDDDDDDEIDWNDVREMEKEQHDFSTRVWYGSWCVYTNVPHKAGQQILCDYNWHRNIGTLVSVGYVVVNSTRDLFCFPFSWDDSTVARRKIEDNWYTTKDDILFYHPDRHSDRYDSVCVRRVDGLLTPQSLGLLRIALLPGTELSAYAVQTQLTRYGNASFMAQPLSARNEHDVYAYAFETCQYFARQYPGDDVTDRHVVRVLTALAKKGALTPKEYMKLLITQMRIEERDTLRKCLKHYAPLLDADSPYEWSYTKGTVQVGGRTKYAVFRKLKLKPQPKAVAPAVPVAATVKAAAAGLDVDDHVARVKAAAKTLAAAGAKRRAAHAKATGKTAPRSRHRSARSRQRRNPNQRRHGHNPTPGTPTGKRARKDQGKRKGKGKRQGKGKGKGKDNGKRKTTTAKGKGSSKGAATKAGAAGGSVKAHKKHRPTNAGAKARSGAAATRQRKAEQQANSPAATAPAAAAAGAAKP